MTPEEEPVPAESDRRLREGVEEAFCHHPVLSRRTIRVEVRSGVLTLGGWVASRSEWSEAEEVARSTPGIETVDNELRVEGQLRVAF